MRRRFDRRQFGFEGRRSTPGHYGDGAALRSDADDSLAGYVRAGGERCPHCGGGMEPEDTEHSSQEIIVWHRCGGCQLTMQHVYRFVDAF